MTVLTIMGFIFVVVLDLTESVRLEARRKIRGPFQQNIGSKEDKKWTESLRTGTTLSLLIMDYYCLAQVQE